MPVLANALAAGFLARAGDLARAKRHVADLGTRRAERSYMWSALVRELSVAGVAVHDDALCSELLADLVPVEARAGSAPLSSRSPAARSPRRIAHRCAGRGRWALFVEAWEAYHRLGAKTWLEDLDLDEAHGVLHPRPTRASLGPPVLPPHIG